MKYVHKKLPESIIEVEVSLEHQEFLNYYQPVYDRALSGVEIKGFRPGAAPKELAEKAVNKEKVFEEAVLKAVKDSLRQISEEKEWQFIDQPKIEILETEPQKDLGLKFKAVLALFPEIKLGNYQKIAKKILKENKKEIIISDGELKSSIDWILNSRAKLVRVNREAKMGDVADIDFTGTADGKTPDGLSGKNEQFILGRGKFVPGFEEHIAGRKEGDNFEFSVDFPQDYWNPDLKGKKADFKVSLKSVFERELPVLTDEFAKSLGKFQNAEDFKRSVKEGLAQEKTEKEKERFRLKIIGEIIKNSRIELPNVMVERTLDNMAADYKMLVKNGKISDEELRKSLEEKARNNVATNLALYQIAKEQHIEPSREEIEKEASRHNVDPQKIYDYSYGVVQNRKVFEYLESLK